MNEIKEFEITVTGYVQAESMEVAEELYCALEWSPDSHEIRELTNAPQIARSVFVDARLWVDKSGGNTYHAARVWVDGKCAGVAKFQFGYEYAYLESALETLRELGYTTARGWAEFTRELRERGGVDIYHTHNYTTRREVMAYSDTQL